MPEARKEMIEPSSRNLRIRVVRKVPSPGVLISSRIKEKVRYFSFTAVQVWERRL
jgi:hypothetical protein